MPRENNEFANRSIREAQNRVTIQQFKDDLAFIGEFTGLQAKLCWSYKQSLEKEGFSTSQAMELVKAHGFMPPAPSSGLHKGKKGE